MFEMLAGRRAFKAGTWEEACAVQNEEELPNLQTLRPDIGAETAELFSETLRAYKDCRQGRLPPPRANPTSPRASGPLAGDLARTAASRSGPGADGRQGRPSYVSATLLGSCPFATPRSVVRQPRLAGAFDILP